MVFLFDNVRLRNMRSDGRKDYYLRRAAAFPWSTEECHALLEAALEIDAQNASVGRAGRKG